MSEIGKLSDAVVDDILDAYFGNQSTSIPTTYYVGLSLDNPTNDGTGASEPDSGGYARVAVDNDDTNWPSSVARVKSNGVAISFPTASAAWGTVAFFVIYKDATSIDTADFIGWGELDTPTDVASGGVLDFPPGALTIEGD